MIIDLAITAAVVLAINLLPAFGPPTWVALAFLRINLHVAAVPLVLVGALSSATGRLLLAKGSRRLRGRFSPERLAGLDALRRRLTDRRGATVAVLGAFLISPLPSAQLFVAAGVSDIALVPITAAFFCGRLVTYSIYVAGTVVAVARFGDVLTRGVYSPLGVALQLLMLAGLVVLLRVDWAARLGVAPLAPRPPAGDPKRPGRARRPACARR